jgi:hypothetical protein
MDPMEKNEYLLKLMLVLVRDRKAMQGRIRSVGYFREFGALPDDMGVYTLSRLNDDEIVSLAESVGIGKRPANAKSDIYLNDLGYSFQFSAAAPLVLLPGVAREELHSVCRRVNVPVQRFDERIEEFWKLRMNAGIGEEVRISELPPQFQDLQEWLYPVLEFFLFTGTEKGESPFPADYVFEYADPLNTNTWAIYDKKQTMELLRDQLWMRAKGESERDWVLHVQAKRETAAGRDS